MRLRRTDAEQVLLSREEFDTCRYVAAQLLLHDEQARPLVEILEATHQKVSECSGQKRQRSGVLARLYSRLRSLVGAA